LGWLNNLFRYCHNDPIDLTDPMGLEQNYAQTGPPTAVSHTGSIIRADEEYGRLMAAMQWAGSNLMHGTSGAIGIGMVGYQEWSTFQKGLASAMAGQGHDPVIGGKNYYSYSSWQKAGDAYARIAQIYTDAYHVNGYLYQNKDNSPDFIGTTPPQAGTVGHVKDAFVSGVFNRSEFVDKAPEYFPYPSAW
jgi:hypothetical protein